MASQTLNTSWPLIPCCRYRRSTAYTGDVVIIGNRRFRCQIWAAGGTPAYCYRSNTRPNGASLVSGAAHYDEVASVFDNTHGYGYCASPNPSENEPQSYCKLARMSSSWASFIHDLDPNSFRLGDTVTPLRPMYDNADRRNLAWYAEVSVLAYAEPDTFRSKDISTLISSLYLPHPSHCLNAERHELGPTIRT